MNPCMVYEPETLLGFISSLRYKVPAWSLFVGLSAIAEWDIGRGAVYDEVGLSRHVGATTNTVGTTKWT